MSEREVVGATEALKRNWAIDENDRTVSVVFVAGLRDKRICKNALRVDSSVVWVRIVRFRIVRFRIVRFRIVRFRIVRFRIDGAYGDSGDRLAVRPTE
ncbi:hypothetical protein JCM31271_26210 [Halorubrum trueperi]